MVSPNALNSTWHVLDIQMLDFVSEILLNMVSIQLRIYFKFL